MKFSIFVFVTLFSLTAVSQFIVNPEDTRVVIAGVLSWQDPNVASFSDVNRKDQELHDLFKHGSVPDSANILLLDQEATLEKMNRNIKKQMKTCTSESTFIFYYAGHGSKIDNNHYFCNYDMGKSEASMFHVSTLSDYAKLYFKGKRIILMADCCYSGSLLKVGEDISKLGIEVIVLTSATSSNISTGNWTFTQTILDCMRGDLLADQNLDNKISLTETAFEVKQAMKYREYQLCGYASYKVQPDEIFVGVCDEEVRKPSTYGQGIKLGTYVYALNENNEWKPARVIKSVAGSYTVQFYNYSEKLDLKAENNAVRSVYFPVYSSGQKVEVKWEGKYYPAEIISTDDAFMYIHYTGYDNSYDEWVMYDRIRTGKEIAKSIKWEGAWYPGYILEKRDTAYFISYEGYSHTWDEWVSPERVK